MTRRDTLRLRVFVDEHSGDESPSDFEQYLTDVFHFYDDLDIEVVMDGRERTLSDDIMDVWGGYGDSDSRDYIGFVLARNALEYREAESWDEARGELADQAICAIRALYEGGVDPEFAIRCRIRERMAGQQDDIIETYKRRYALAVGDVADVRVGVEE